MMKAQQQNPAQSIAAAASPSQALTVENLNRRNVYSGSASSSSYPLPSTSQPTTAGSQVKAPNKRSRASGLNGSAESLRQLDVYQRTATSIENGPKFEYERNIFPANVYTTVPSPALQGLSWNQQPPPNPLGRECPYCGKSGFKDKSKLE